MTNNIFSNTESDTSAFRVDIIALRLEITLKSVIRIRAFALKSSDSKDSFPASWILEGLCSNS